MTRQKAATPRGEYLARAATYELNEPATTGQASERELTRRARGRLERPVRGGRMRPGSGRSGAAAVPIRPTVIRTHRLLVTGELGYDSAAALEGEIDVLCASGIDELMLDLGGLRRIDATGIRVIAMRCALCEKRGMRIELARVGAALRAAFVSAGLADRMPPAEGGEVETDERSEG